MLKNFIQKSGIVLLAWVLLFSMSACMSFEESEEQLPHFLVHTLRESELHISLDIADLNAGTVVDKVL